MRDIIENNKQYLSFVINTKNTRNMIESSIGKVDLLIVAVYLIFIIWWGLKHGKSKDSQSYFLAGRSTSWKVIGFSMFAASISTTTLIGQSGDAYHTGIAVFNYNLVGVVIMVLFAFFLLPLYIRSKIYTIPEFLERRFDHKSRYYFSAICIFGNIFLDAAGALYAASLIIRIIFPEVDIQLITLFFGLVVACYVIPGGLSSVINAELIQAVVLIIGSTILSYFCFEKGYTYFHNLIVTDDILVKLIRPIDDTATPWLGLIVGMPILSIYYWGNNQTLVQRVLSAKSIDEGRRGVILSGFLLLSTLFIIILPGLIAKYIFPNLETADAVYPTMLLKLMPLGFIGILLAALISALLSALSAVVNSTSTLFTMDFYAKWNKKADSKKQVYVGKVTAVIIITIAALWAPHIGQFGSLLKYYQEMLSYLCPPIVATFVMGIFNKRVNARGAFFGLIGGLLLAILTFLFKKEIFGDIHFLLIVPVLFLSSILIIYLISFTAPAPQKKQLENTTFNRQFLETERQAFRCIKWYKNYQVWSLVLLLSCAILWIVFC